MENQSVDYKELPSAYDSLFLLTMCLVGVTFREFRALLVGTFKIEI